MWMWVMQTSTLNGAELCAVNGTVVSEGKEEINWKMELQ